MKKFLVLCMFCLVFVANNIGQIVYVNQNATGNNDGSSWANAYTHLHTALIPANANKEIWIAAGTYSPGTSRTSRYHLYRTYKFYGNFAGTETDKNQRIDTIPHTDGSYRTNETIITGDIGIAGNPSDNIANIFTIDDNGSFISTVTFDCLTIEKGYSNIGSYRGVAAAIYSNNAQLILNNMLIKDNTVISEFEGKGAGVYSNSYVIVKNSVFLNNNVETIHHNTSHSARGGAICVDASANISNSYFKNNTATAANTNANGGAIYSLGSTFIIYHSTFSDNLAKTNGGAIYIGNPSYIRNCLFNNNTASFGGSMFLNTSTDIINTTVVSNNASSNGGGIWFANTSSTYKITNSIIWGNNAPTNPNYRLNTGTANFSYSLIAGYVGGTNNIDVNPLLVDTLNRNFRLTLSSPAKDVGNNNAISSINPPILYDLDGNQRILNNTVDLGAFETAIPIIPVAAFSADFTNILTGGSVTFSDLSSNTPTSWNWQFAVGAPSGSCTPATSTLQNRTVVYNQPGIYTVRLTASNAAGSNTHEKTAYITVTAPTAPTITTSNATNISQFSAICGGNVTNEGSFPVTARGVCWSTSQNPTTANNTTTDGAGGGVFSSSITGLSPSTTYYVRAYATNSVGTSYGNEISFTTTSSATIPVANFSADFTNILTGGSVTFSDLSSNTPSSWNWQFAVGAPSGSCTPATSTLQNRTVVYNQPGIYTVRLTASNAAGSNTHEKTAYITVTAPTAPTITTSNATNISQFSAICGGNVTNEGSFPVTARGVCWSTSQNPTTANNTTTDGTGGGVFSSSITGLSPSTTYYVRAYATNSVGTSYGNEISFTTTSSATIPVANFTANTTTITVGNSVVFTDLSTNVPTMWNWEFAAGAPSSSCTPAISTSQNVTVVYNQPGIYTVRLTASNVAGSNTHEKIAYITVSPATNPPLNDDCSNAILLISNTTCNQISASTIDATQSLSAIFCNGYIGNANDDVWFKFVAASSNPTIRVESGAGFDAIIDLRSGNCNGVNIDCADQTGVGGIETLNTTGLTIGNTYYIRVYGYGTLSSFGNFTICVTDPSGTAPVANFSASQTNIIIGNSITFNDLSTNTPTLWNWEFAVGAPSSVVSPATSTNQNPTVTYNTPGTYTVKLTASNSFGSDTVEKNNYIIVNINVGVKKENKNPFIIFPNPSHGKVNIFLPNAYNNPIRIILYDVIGNLIIESSFECANNYSIDLSHLPNGVYMVNVVTLDAVYVDKIIIQK